MGNKIVEKYGIPNGDRGEVLVPDEDLGPLGLPPLTVYGGELEDLILEYPEFVFETWHDGDAHGTRIKWHKYQAPEVISEATDLWGD